MFKRRTQSFSLIELIVSMFIMSGLLIIGFYSFNKLQRNSEIQKTSSEIVAALETAHSYSLNLPIEIGTYIQDVTYIGVMFNKNASDTTVKSYEYFYTKCGITNINTFGNTTSLDPNCAINSNIIRIGEEHFLPKNVKITKNNNPLYPIVLFNIKRADLALWCNSTDCGGTRQFPLIADDPVINNEKVFNIGANKTIKINILTGIVNEQNNP